MTQDSHSIVEAHQASSINSYYPKLSRLQSLLTLIATAIAGAIATLSMAPWDYWPIGLISFGVLTLALTRPMSPFLLTLVFACGFFGTGASWVYVSIHQFGMTSKPLAILLTSVFVFGLAVVFALPYLLFRRLVGFSPTTIIVFGAPGFWLFGEWLRSWFLTGFPWLYLGYGHLSSPLAGYAPVGGVLLITTASILSVGFFIQSVRLVGKKQKLSAGLLAATVAGIWLTGSVLSTITWTQKQDTEINVGIVQANIPQEVKWLQGFRQTTLDRFTSMTNELWHNDLIIWPEAAIPMLYQSARPYLDEMSDAAKEHNSAIVTGVLYENFESRKIHNSIIGIGNAEGIYHKTRLVPFGEYVPLEQWLRGTLAFFDLPTSIIAAGEPGQSGLKVGDLIVSPSVCYEVVYPTLVAGLAQNSHLLLTISNDAWFGDSIGPLQHMQMAQMRALETQRYLVRATNNGISAVVDPTGKMTEQTAQFTQETLSGTIVPMTGATPFMTWKNTPVIALFLGLIFCAFLTRRATAPKSYY
ncbi:apolipoprotein N-acyltransferase [Sessilibacter corallicola]|uniref:Apolipoprotein N-acyltransferase n=1 Tax=Sessilibacter corallicola TaxID=2904075 RepID=A0ABQ0A6U9_9GAMM